MVFGRKKNKQEPDTADIKKGRKGNKKQNGGDRNNGRRRQSKEGEEQEGKRRRRRYPVDPLTAEFRKQLEENGLIMRRMAPDGNCLFRALAHQYYEDHTEHMNVRKETCDYIEQHREDFEPFIETGLPFQRHVASLRKRGTYGGSENLVAFSRLHKEIAIAIHQYEQPVWIIYAGEEEQPERTVHLSYHNGEHYNALRDKGEDEGEDLEFVFSGSLDMDDEEHMIQAIMKATEEEDIDLVRDAFKDNEHDMDATIEFLESLKLTCGSEANTEDSQTSDGRDRPASSEGRIQENSPQRVEKKLPLANMTSMTSARSNASGPDSPRRVASGTPRSLSAMRV
eukprot:Clim_evm27s166 gene=Clim_evmTU27s166